jgi:hypothetical protein
MYVNERTWSEITVARRLKYEIPITVKHLFLGEFWLFIIIIIFVYCLRNIYVVVFIIIFNSLLNRRNSIFLQKKKKNALNKFII